MSKRRTKRRKRRDQFNTPAAVKRRKTVAESMQEAFSEATRLGLELKMFSQKHFRILLPPDSGMSSVDFWPGSGSVSVLLDNRTHSRMPKRYASLIDVVRFAHRLIQPQGE